MLPKLHTGHFRALWLQATIHFKTGCDSGLWAVTFATNSNPEASVGAKPDGPAIPDLAFTHNNAIALAIFVADFALYLTFVLLALAPIGLLPNIASSIAAGIMIGAIFTLGHDACHQALTSHPRLNNWLGRIAFIPSVHAVSLWILGHNQIHHGFTNLKGRDYVWQPMSPAEYAAAPSGRRLFYRVIRGPCGALPYYLIEMWWKKNFIPIAPEARKRWRTHLFDSVFVVVSQIVLIAAIIGIGHFLDPSRSILSNMLLGWLLPFLVWNWLMGVVIYLHHTHPHIIWFDEHAKWKAAQVKLFHTAHVRLPQPLHVLSNNIMEHNAHHLDPSVPFYHLATAQAQLRRLTDEIIHFKVGARSYLDIVRTCQLFDFDRGCWVRFDEQGSTARLRPGVYSGASE
jgi:omega-6 fatty acid desaturase (delta-12 desaturase)